MPTDWDAANIATSKHLPTVNAAVSKFVYTHPHWWVRATVEQYPPRICISCFLVAPERTRRTTTGVNVGATVRDTNWVQALTPTDAELIEIGDFIGGLETEDFTPRRMWGNWHLPWINYELRPKYERYVK